MSVANQYGINVGNILSQASNIKTARLNREKNQLALDKTKAGIALREDALDKKSNALAQENVDESLQGGIEGGYVEPIETLSQEEVNKLSALAPEVSREIAQTQQAQQQQQALKRMYMSKGETEEDATFKSSMDIKDVADFDKMYQTKDKIQKTQIRDGVAQQGRMIQGLLEVAEQDPQAANQQFMNYRTDKLKQINELRKQGKNAEADQIEKGLQRVPETLLSADGKFNASYLTLTLGKLNSMLTTAESYEKSQVAETKQENLLALEQERQKKPKSTGTTKEFESLMNLLDKTTDPKKRKMIQDRITKLSQTDRTSLLINMNTVKQAQNNFASKMNLDDPYKLSTVDTREWTPEQQAEGNQVASIIIKGLGANAKQVEKKMGEYGALSDQMQNSITGYESVGDFRAADEFTKKYFSNYFGLSEEELQSTEAAQAFQSMLNIKIKADSGSAVSGQEMVRNVLETATPYMQKERIIKGIRNVAKRYKGELTALKKVMGPVAFNLKYGSVLKNYEEIADATKDENIKDGKESDADRIERLEKTKETPRQKLYNQIKTQRPNATKEQIENYLTSKGY